LASIEAHDRYFNLLKQKNNPEDVLVHGRTYLEKLIKAVEKSKSCNLYLECSKLDKLFTIESKYFLKLAGWLKQSGYFNEAIRAYSAFTKAYSQDPMIPNAYFRAAEIFNEQLNQKAKAKTILNGLIKKYPDHDIIPFAKNYLRGITP
jgi:tetratricopeptide (TPR) repeat protein